MRTLRNQRARIADRINALVERDRPLSGLARVAKYAIDEANTLSIERVEISLSRLPKKLDQFRILHLSDIHHSPFTGLEHIARAVRIASQLNPDLVVLTGDYVSHEAKYIAPAAKVLGELRGRLGVFACLGNHDHWTDAELVTRHLENAGIRVLTNEGTRIESNEASFWLGGVDDHMVGKTDLPLALKGSFPDEFKLLLAHNPIIFRRAARAGIDLTLSGHTHGGQVRVRDNDQRLIRRRRTAGLHKLKDSQIYITRGIGTVVLPIRFQCPPEISVLELRSAT
ncbi:MAG: metallophosphoesterase [bacterium]|nr:metallophosphoesterase [bacterium]